RVPAPDRDDVSLRDRRRGNGRRSRRTIARPHVAADAEHHRRRGHSRCSRGGECLASVDQPRTELPSPADVQSGSRGGRDLPPPPPPPPPRPQPGLPPPADVKSGGAGGCILPPPPPRPPYGAHVSVENMHSAPGWN